MNADDIHQIAVPLGGDRMDTYSVGQTFKAGAMAGFTVAKILRDENNFHKFGQVRYIVCVSKDGGDEQIWKTYEGPIPIYATYKVNTNQIK